MKRDTVETMKIRLNDMDARLEKLETAALSVDRMERFWEALAGAIKSGIGPWAPPRREKAPLQLAIWANTMAQFILDNEKTWRSLEKLKDAGLIT